MVGCVSCTINGVAYCGAAITGTPRISLRLGPLGAGHGSDAGKARSAVPRTVLGPGRFERGVHHVKHHVSHRDTSKRAVSLGQERGGRLGGRVDAVDARAGVGSRAVGWGQAAAAHCGKGTVQCITPGCAAAVPPPASRGKRGDVAPIAGVLLECRLDDLWDRRRSGGRQLPFRAGRCPQRQAARATASSRSMEAPRRARLRGRRCGAHPLDVVGGMDRRRHGRLHRGGRGHSHGCPSRRWAAGSASARARSRAAAGVVRRQGGRYSRDRSGGTAVVVPSWL